MSEPSVQNDWLKNLGMIVRARPIAILQPTHEEWSLLRKSRRGLSEFTLTYPHTLVDHVRAPTLCLIESADQGAGLRIGVLRSKSAISTLDSRIKVLRTILLDTESLTELTQLLTDPTHFRNFQRRIDGESPIVVLSPKLSEHIVNRLATVESNRVALRSMADSLEQPSHFRNNAALQENAIQTALKAFGVHVRDDAVHVEVTSDEDTGLRRVWIHEDAVIEHDARRVPGFDLVESDLTGRAVFENEDTRLVIITANKRTLEEAFGVDLVIANLTHSNVAMIQYKMLEPMSKGSVTDWIYRPDQQLDSEIARMRRFDVDLAPSGDYRLNAGIFYLKFVRRDGAMRHAGIITPLDHFETLRNAPAFQGPRGGFRITHSSLAGRYLREEAFLSLISSGYLGARAETTARLKTLIDGVLEGNRALVAAIKTARATPSEA